MRRLCCDASFANEQQRSNKRNVARVFGLGCGVSNGSRSVAQIATTSRITDRVVVVRERHVLVYVVGKRRREQQQL